MKKDQIQYENEKLQEFNIPYTCIEEESARYMIYRCEKGHKFEGDRYRVRKGQSKCPTCDPGVGRKMTHEAYENKLMEIESLVYPIEKYKGIHVPILHSCVEGHEQRVAPTAVLHGQGCPRCTGYARITETEYKELLKQINPTIELIDTYVNKSIKILHKCKKCQHEWKVDPFALTNATRRTGCPACAVLGFNPTKPAWLYYVKLWDDRQTLYKIGITNKTVPERLKFIPKNKRILLERYFENGYEAKATEQMILDEYGDLRVFAPQFLPTGGYTELFKEDILLLDVD